MATDFMGGSELAVSMVQKSNLPLDTKTLADSREQVLTTLPKHSRFIGLKIFCTKERRDYIFIDGIEDENFVEWRGGGQVLISDEPPTDTEMVWINPESEKVDANINSQVLREFREVVGETKNKVDELHYKYNYTLDAGEITLKDKEKPTDPNIYESSGNIQHILIKRGEKSVLQVQLLNWEMGYATDEGAFYLKMNGKLELFAKIGGIVIPPEEGGDDDLGNLTTTYLDLLSPNGTKYRMAVTNQGELTVYNALVDEGEDARPENAGAFAGLIVNQIYGGGIMGGNAPVSHSFIELYNNTPNEINLKGLSLQYAEYNLSWNVLQLKGLVKPYHSFLIRCGQCADPTAITTRLSIDRYDMTWDIPLTDKGMKACLIVGRGSVGVTNPSNIGGNGTTVLGYIDMLSAGGEDVTKVIDGYEGNFGHFLSKNKAVHRRDFTDTNDNAKDVDVTDFTKANIPIYKPRSTWDGSWDIYYNKIKLDTTRPNMINICFGENGNNTRTFTWQSTPTEKGYLMYKKSTDTSYTIVETTKRPIQHHDTDAIVHSCIITDLESGTYVYKAGEEGKWSDEYSFVIKPMTNKTGFTFCQTSDQQGWNEREYKDWDVAHAKILEYETFDWMLNTGDMSQNANRSFEWRYYYEHAKETTNNKVHMTTCGNNDLINKKDSTAFTYYFTYEGGVDHPSDSTKKIPSVYSYDYGCTHFVCLNSNELIEEQCVWLREDLQKARARGVRWVIAYMHLAPYSIIINTKQQPFAPIFEEFKVDLVLCGHNHTYIRTKPIKNGEVDMVNGVPYVMCQATGYKLSGKEKPLTPPPAWYAHQVTPNQPSYIMWDVSYDKITMKAYRLDGLQPLELGREISRTLYDSVEILPR